MTETGIPRPPEGRRTLAVAGVAALLLLLGSYADHFRNGFHFDDSHVIEDNLFVRGLGHWPRFFTDATTFSTVQSHQTYRPLVTLSFAVDYALAGGLDPRVFQATQLLLHLLVAVGAYLIFRQAARRAVPGWASTDLVALFAATWYAVHTANTETVNYLSARSDVLSTLGIVASFVVYLYLPGLRRWQVYLVPMSLGALAKPPAVMFAPLLLAWIVLFEMPPLGSVRREGRAAWWRDMATRVAPAFVVGAAAFAFTSAMDAAAQSYEGGAPLAYLWTQAWVWLHDLRLFVLPVGLTADTDWALIPHVYDTRVIVGVLAVAALAWASMRTSKGAARPVAFGLIWFAFGLLPSSSVIPLAEVTNEHRLYLPFVGLALAATWLGALALGRARARSPRAGPVFAVAGGALLLAHATGTFVRNRVWRTDETLWADVVAKSPGNGRAWMNYGLTRMEVGRYQEAKDLFTRATAEWPRYAPAFVNLGVVNGAMHDTLAADASFRTALELDPRSAAAHFFLGRYLTEVGRGPEALDEVRQAATLAPAWEAPRHLLLPLYFATGDDKQVREIVRSTLEIAPSDAEARAYQDRVEPAAEGTPSWFQRGVDDTAAGKHLDAAVAYRRHLASHPDDPDALLNLGWSLANLGFDELAADRFRQVLAIQPDYALAANNLAWVTERISGRK